MHLLLFGSCGFIARNTEYGRFRQQPIAQQQEQFQTFPIEKQVDYLHYCNLNNHCDQFILEEIAARGKAGLPYLLFRMKTRSDMEKWEIAMVLQLMHERYYPIRDGGDVEAIRSNIEAMSDSDYKYMASIRAREIVEFHPADY